MNDLERFILAAITGNDGRLPRLTITRDARATFGSKARANDAIKELQRRGLVHLDDGVVYLTDAGRDATRR